MVYAIIGGRFSSCELDQRCEIAEFLAFKWSHDGAIILPISTLVEKVFERKQWSLEQPFYICCIYLAMVLILSKKFLCVSLKYNTGKFMFCRCHIYLSNGFLTLLIYLDLCSKNLVLHISLIFLWKNITSSIWLTFSNSRVHSK